MALAQYRLPLRAHGPALDPGQLARPDLGFMAAARNLGQARLSSACTRPHSYQGKVGRGVMFAAELVARTGWSRAYRRIDGGSPLK